MKPSRAHTIPTSRRAFLLTTTLGAAVLARAAHAERSQPANHTRLASFELADQFGRSHRIEFPRSRPLLLLVSDRKGSAEVDDWIPPLKKHWGTVADIAGIADVHGIPSFLRDRIRTAIRENRKSPVMLDFEGEITRQLDCADRKANVFLFDPSGKLAAVVTGRPDDSKLATIRAAITPWSPPTP